MKTKKFHSRLVEQLAHTNRALADVFIEMIGETPTQGAIERVIKIAKKDSLMGINRDLLAEIQREMK